MSFYYRLQTRILKRKMKNLVKKNDAVNAVEDNEKITDLIDADDGDTDGGDDQHGHHPNLV